MTIKYLVLGGGGPAGYSIYGAIKYLDKNNFFDINNIKNIYCVSIGSFIAVLISLKLEWKVIDDYLIKRPWDKVFNIDPIKILNLWKEKGIFDCTTVFKELLTPLLTVQGLSENITLKEFYDYNNIEIHIYTVNINTIIPTKIDLSYKTHPNLELYKALSMSSAYPIILIPICDNSGCYIDGGLLNNFPLNDCIYGINALENNILDEILAFKKYNSCNKYLNITKDSLLIDYLYVIISRTRNLASLEYNQIEIKNIVKCNVENNSYSIWKDALFYEHIRKEIIENGEKSGEQFLKN